MRGLSFAGLSSVAKYGFQLLLRPFNVKRRTAHVEHVALVYCVYCAFVALICGQGVLMRKHEQSAGPENIANVHSLRKRILANSHVSLNYRRAFAFLEILQDVFKHAVIDGFRAEYFRDHKSNARYYNNEDNIVIAGKCLNCKHYCRQGHFHYTRNAGSNTENEDRDVIRAVKSESTAQNRSKK